MNEELVTLVVEGEIEIYKFIDVQILKSWVVRNCNVGDLIDGDEWAVILCDLGEDDVDFVFKE